MVRFRIAGSPLLYNSACFFIVLPDCIVKQVSVALSNVEYHGKYKHRSSFNLLYKLGPKDKYQFYGTVVNKQSRYLDLLP
ncbi:hypothetical protein QQG55_25735 [Brugia pahangi]|uniref:Ovule protein n=1 Tax=Brugia pahangi TaxID=6280 RepID=A0A0N4T2T0_BRUPA|nr:unnamed protein product [Brugia pahangi]